MRERGAVMAVRARVCPDGPRSVTPRILLAGPLAATLILHWGPELGLRCPRGGQAGPAPSGCLAGLGEELERAPFGRSGGRGVVIAALLGLVQSSVPEGIAAFQGRIFRPCFP